MTHCEVSKLKCFPYVITIFLLFATALNGCAAVVGTGATVGVAAAQERGIKGRAEDLRLEVLLAKKYINAGLKLTTIIGVEVYKGRVLLTGATRDTKISDQAVKLAWQLDGVKEVINEIQVDQGTTVTDYAHDTWITTQLKSKLTFDKDVLAINYAVETVNGTIYLIGIAQNQQELERVVAHANNINRVTNVISHVQMKKKAFEES